jgi:hypothetical protein
VLKKVKPTPNIDYFREFWTFVAERQAIYWRRMAGKPRPWTQDPILNEYFFTNVYRELDGGTRYYLENISGMLSPNSLVFDTLAYRYFNNEPTWDFLCSLFDATDSGVPYVPWGKWRHEHVAYALSKWEQEGHKPFTSAFTVTGIRFGGYPDKISNVCWLIGYFQDQTKALVKEVVNANSLRDIFGAVVNLQGIGHFLAYQIAVDLSYTWLVKRSVNRDQFADPGPGCRRGLNYIFPGMRNYEQLIYKLRDTQDVAFSRYGLKFKPVGSHIMASDIENCLCEFSKYVRYKYETKKSGRARKYQPRKS